MRIKINLDSPLSGSVSMPATKYGKSGWVAQQIDDGIYDGYDAIVDIWKANDHHYTDGCGNKIYYSAEVAVTIDSGAEDKKPRMLKVIAENGTIDNHSASHNPDNQIEQTIIMDDQIIEILGIKMSTFVIPVDYPGFANASYSIGYRGITSEGDNFDQFNSVRHHKIIPDEPILDFDPFVRDVKDDHSSQEVKDLFKENIDMLFNGQRNFYIMGTHSDLATQPQKDGFKEIYDYLYNLANDTILMCTVQEFLDYRTMRSLPMNQTVTGNSVTIDFNTNNAPDRLRWADISLNIPFGSRILSVETDDFDSFSFNSDTGLVNAKKILTSSLPPIEDILIVKHGNFIL